MKRIMQQIREKVKIAIGAVLALTFLIMAVSPALALDGIPAYVQTPQSMVKWFQSDFTYAWTIPFSKKTPQEMVKTKMGACYDFAILASEILTKLKIANTVVILKFQGTRVGHALCIWQDEDGTYNYVSNKKIVYTGAKSINEAIMKNYPDTERIIVDSQKTL